MPEPTNPRPADRFPGLTEGRIVHYVLPSWMQGVDASSAGRHVPALVVRVWLAGDGLPQTNGLVNLHVFPDGSNDMRAQAGNMGVAAYDRWATSVEYDADGREGSWHWIEPA